MKRSRKSLLTVIITAVVTTLAINWYRDAHPSQIVIDIPRQWADAPLHEGINKFKKDGVEMTVIIGQNPNIVDD